MSRGFRLMKNINKLGELKIYIISKLSKENAAEAQLQNKDYEEMPNLSWSRLRSSPEEDAIEVLLILQPPHLPQVFAPPVVIQLCHLCRVTSKLFSDRGFTLYKS